SPRGNEEPCAANHEPQRRAEPDENRGRTAGVPHRLEALLPLGGDTQDLQRPRPMAAPPTACRTAQAVETGNDGLSRTSRPGSPGPRGPRRGRPCPPLVGDRLTRGAQDRAAYFALRSARRTPPRRSVTH